MTVALPQKTRKYQNHTLDSEKWRGFKRRKDDIIIATPYKCGTTWMQAIVLQLVFGGEGVRPIGEVSPWLDFAPKPDGETQAVLDAQTHRRVIKTHTPLDGFEYDPDSRFIVVGRDPRDVFMSLWNHYSNYTEFAISEFNDRPDRVGARQPRCPDDIREFWNMWINKGWFEGEDEGYPFWSNFHHVQSWWNFRHLPNIQFIHYNNLLDDLEREIAGIAAYLEIECSAELIAKITDKVTFSSMKRQSVEFVGHNDDIFEGGSKIFINKGTNGRWRDVLTKSDLEDYDRTASRTLTPECRAWLETGVY